jgi:hypothetical protein
MHGIRFFRRFACVVNAGLLAAMVALAARQRLAAKA